MPDMGGFDYRKMWLSIPLRRQKPGVPIEETALVEDKEPSGFFCSWKNRSRRERLVDMAVLFVALDAYALSEMFDHPSLWEAILILLLAPLAFISFIAGGLMLIFAGWLFVLIWCSYLRARLSGEAVAVVEFSGVLEKSPFKWLTVLHGLVFIPILAYLIITHFTGGIDFLEQNFQGEVATAIVSVCLIDFALFFYFFSPYMMVASAINFILDHLPHDKK